MICGLLPVRCFLYCFVRLQFEVVVCLFYPAISYRPTFLLSTRFRLPCVVPCPDEIILFPRRGAIDGHIGGTRGNWPAGHQSNPNGFALGPSPLLGCRNVNTFWFYRCLDLHVENVGTLACDEPLSTGFPVQRVARKRIVFHSNWGRTGA